MYDGGIYRATRSDNLAAPLTPQQQLDEVTREFVNNLGRVADFFGFNKLIGQLYAILFISPEPLTLDDMVERLRSSKGNVSINIRALERLGLVRQIYKWADRKNYYEAETDIWKAISRILQERERKEAQQIADTLTQNQLMLEEVRREAAGTPEANLADFYLQRLEILHRLFDFGGSLLDMMVQGGAVDFGTASRLAQPNREANQRRPVPVEENQGQPIDELDEVSKS